VQAEYVSDVACRYVHTGARPGNVEKQVQRDIAQHRKKALLSYTVHPDLIHEHFLLVFVLQSLSCNVLPCMPPTCAQ
jgi:hypothetical protein